MSSSTPSTFAFAEIAPHSIQLAVISGRRLIGLRSFALDAKAEIAAFVAEHGITGTLRASFFSSKAGLHLSSAQEASSIRTNAALLAFARKAYPALENPAVVAVDASTGLAPNSSKPASWVMAAADGACITEARQLLTELGLAPSEFTLASPTHLGAVSASLSSNQIALVVMPGENEAALAWVGSQGVREVATAQMGFSAIYEAVQHGLGLKFKAAAGKLLYNENYDFSEAAPKISASLAEVLRPSLNGKNAAGLLHITGLTGSQPWLVESLAKALGLGVWAPPAEKLLAGLEAGDAKITTSSAGILRMVAQGSGDAPWLQSTLDVMIARAANPVVAPAPAVKPAAPAAARSVQAGGGKTNQQAKSTPPASAAAPAPIRSVAVTEQTPVAPVGKKSNKGPILIASAVGVVAAVVGLAMHFRSPAPRPEAKAEPAPTEQSAPADNTPATGSTPASAPTPPVISSVPAPAPLTIPSTGATTPSAGSSSVAQLRDIFAGDSRRYGNERYRFEVTPKGFIQALATVREEVLVESAAGISLQGSYVGTDGRRKWFNVGGVDDAGYQANVTKAVRDGLTVFDVKVTHPRFELTQTFECHAEAIKVSVKFTPINLRDPRGVIAAVHSVRLSPVALNPSLRMRAAADSFAYAMKTGTLRIAFDNTAWARDSSDARQTIVAGENGVAFHFTDSNEVVRNELTYEISVP